MKIMEMTLNIRTEEVKLKIFIAREQNQYRKYILSKYLDVFSNKMGTMNDVELKLNTNLNIKPTQAAGRPINIHLRDKVEKSIH